MCTRFVNYVIVLAYLQSCATVTNRFWFDSILVFVGGLLFHTKRVELELYLSRLSDGLCSGSDENEFSDTRVCLACER